MDAIYKSSMEEEIGELLQMKSQHDLFGKNEKYIFNGSKKKVRPHPQIRCLRRTPSY